MATVILVNIGAGDGLLPDSNAGQNCWLDHPEQLWKLNQDAIISIQEYAFEYVVCKMSAVFHQSQPIVT